MGDEIKTAPPVSSDCMDKNAIFGDLAENSLDFFYDKRLCHTLQSPSITAQWLPGITKLENTDESIHRLILGTQGEIDKNYLIIATITLPMKTFPLLTNQYESNHDPNLHGESSGAPPPPLSSFRPAAASVPGADFGKFEVKLKIVHDGAVVRARYMPQNPSLIATRTLAYDVLVYDYTKYLDNQDAKPDISLELRLKGHTNSGKGLSWNPTHAGHLLSASEDQTVCLWDVNATPKENRVINAATIYTGHTAKVRDVAWNSRNPHLFGSVSDDTKAMIWDVRCQITNNPVTVVEAHTSAVNCIRFNNFRGNVFLTASSDSTIALWDMRYLNRATHRLTGLQGAVTQVEWSPHNQAVFSSAATDTKVHIWDLSRSAKKMPPGLLEPPELVFVHGGHMTNVADFSWSPTERWLMCSVAENYNTLQVLLTDRHSPIQHIPSSTFLPYMINKIIISTSKTAIGASPTVIEHFTSIRTYHHRFDMFYCLSYFLVLAYVIFSLCLGINFLYFSLHNHTISIRLVVALPS